ncbi:MAG: Kef-type K+ transport system membrane component KefB [Verrucomicrobiales bacterium]|jgi:Kef-type K+ transport system membrane component KefB
MELFYILIVLLVVTRSFGELAKRCHQPELVGQLTGGIILGVVVNHFSGTFPILADLTHNEVFHAFTDLGIFFLMLLGGLEMHPRELGKASHKAFWIALAGLIIPFLAGAGLGWIFIPDSEWKIAQVLFLGTTLAITAIPVAVKVLQDLDLLKTKLGQIIVSAALFDDIFGLILLGLLTGLLKSGEIPGVIGFLLLLLKVVAFLGIASALGRWVLPFLEKRLKKWWIEELEFTMLLLVGLGFALLAEAFGLHFILGVFLAGLFFTKRTIGTKVYEDVEGKVTAISSGFFAPLFFASIGLHLDISAIWNIPVFVILLTLTAIATKFVGAGLAARALGMTNRESAGIGVAMSARGAVELIIAGIAMDAGLFSKPEPVPEIIENLFSAVVLMAVATTLFMPIGLRWILGIRGSKN